MDVLTRALELPEVPPSTLLHPQTSAQVLCVVLIILLSTACTHHNSFILSTANRHVGCFHSVHLHYFFKPAYVLYHFL